MGVRICECVCVTSEENVFLVILCAIFYVNMFKHLVFRKFKLFAGSGCASDYLDGVFNLDMHPQLDQPFVATNGELFPWNSSRLPEFIKPLHYTISIHPNLTTLDVSGNNFLSTLGPSISSLHYFSLCIYS